MGAPFSSNVDTQINFKFSYAHLNDTLLKILKRWFILSTVLNVLNFQNINSKNLKRYTSSEFLSFDFERIVPLDIGRCCDTRFEKWGTTYQPDGVKWIPNKVFFTTINYPPLKVIDVLASLVPAAKFKLDYTTGSYCLSYDGSGRARINDELTPQKMNQQYLKMLRPVAQ